MYKGAGRKFQTTLTTRKCGYRHKNTRIIAKTIHI